MEKKKLQRIIGISVVVALVIVLIPFLFGKREQSRQETAKVVMPITTNDATQTAVVENTNTPTSTDNNINVQNAEENGITPIASPNNTAPAANNDPNNAPAAVVNPSDTTNPSATPAPSAPANGAVQNSSTSNTVVAPTDMANQPVNPSNVQSPSAALTPPASAPSSPNTAPVSADTSANTNANVNTNAPADDAAQMTPAVVTDTDAAHPQVTAEQVTAQQPAASDVKPRHIHKSAMVKKTSHLSSKTVTNVKKTAWVVQMGSFKNQSNAHRLVNQLKGSGFKAFTHVVTSPAGAVRTRVYVGPEFKEASAKKLSAKVAQEVKLQGFVVPL